MRKFAIALAVGAAVGMLSLAVPTDAGSKDPAKQKSTKKTKAKKKKSEHDQPIIHKGE